MAAPILKSGKAMNKGISYSILEKTFFPDQHQGHEVRLLPSGEKLRLMSHDL